MAHREDSEIVVKEAVHDVTKGKAPVLVWERASASTQRRMRCWKLAGNVSEKAPYFTAILVHA